MNENGAKLVAKDAASYLLIFFQDLAIIILNEADQIKINAKQKRLDEKHVLSALAKLGYVCKNCGADLRAGANFCNNCGTKQSSSCPQCGTPLRENSKFCDNCGEKIK